MTIEEIKKKYFGYALDAVSGAIPVCEYVKDACKRNLDRFDRDDMYFDPEAVDKVINFIGHLKHYTGEFAGQPFELQLWQVCVIVNIFGWKWKKDDLRVCRTLYLELGRKNGKTSLCAAILLYLMISDGENNASVILAANSAKQASLCFEMCSNFLKSIDPKGKHFKYFRDSIKFDKTISSIKVVAADSSKLDGLNCSGAMVDETHEAPDDKVYSVLETSMGARRQPLMLAATTAGFDLASFCYDMRTYNVQVLKGVANDDTLQAWIYCLDEGDDWRDENVWEKANPNLGITIKPEYIKSQIEKAKQNPALELSIRTKLTNEWCATAKKSFIPLNYVMDAMEVIDLKEWEDKEITCTIGLDLSSVCDISCVALMWNYEGTYYFKNWYYLPESALRDSVNKEKYRQWANQGMITITEGNSIDYDYIKDCLLKICQQFMVTTINYDPWQSTYLIQKLTEEGLPVNPYSQSIGSMSKPSKELLRLALDGKIKLDKNPCTLYMYQCATPYYDVNENLKIKKNNPEADKIDGVIADVMAVAGVLSELQYDNVVGGINFD